MFRNLSSQLAAAATGSGDKKAMAPTLRSDIYTAIDQVKAWIIGTGSAGIGGGQAGDGVAFQSLVTLTQKHFPKTEIGLDSIGKTENEVAVIVGGVTNMILEMSKWEGMASGMAMRTWVDALAEAYTRLPASSRKDAVAKGITKGVTQNVDVSLMTDFTTKIQIISSLKTLMSNIHGSGSAQARQAEAALASKFI